jgi:hypothetical protein
MDRCWNPVCCEIVSQTCMYSVCARCGGVDLGAVLLSPYHVCVCARARIIAHGLRWFELSPSPPQRSQLWVCVCVTLTLRLNV